MSELAYAVLVIAFIFAGLWAWRSIRIKGRR